MVYIFCPINKKLKGSIRRKVLGGINASYLYFGAAGSTFAFHYEDAELFSISFLHTGSPKIWYCIHLDDTDKLLDYLRKHLSANSKDCPAFPMHKNIILSPELLDRLHIRYTKYVCLSLFKLSFLKIQIQNPGEFIVTFPRGLHFGLNTGENLAEAANFATYQWLAIGKYTIKVRSNLKF
jgi:hypothetical protein